MNDVERELRRDARTQGRVGGRGGPPPCRSRCVRAAVAVRPPWRPWAPSPSPRSPWCRSPASARSTSARTTARAQARSLRSLRGLRANRDDRDCHHHEPERLVPGEPVAAGSRGGHHLDVDRRLVQRSRQLPPGTEPEEPVCGSTSSSPEPVSAPVPVPMLLLSRSDPGLGVSPCLRGGVGSRAIPRRCSRIAIDMPASCSERRSERPSLVARGVR